MARPRKKWSYSAGERPHTVRVYERIPGGVLWARVWDAGKGDCPWATLGRFFFTFCFAACFCFCFFPLGFFCFFCFTGTTGGGGAVNGREPPE